MKIIIKYLNSIALKTRRTMPPPTRIKGDKRSRILERIIWKEKWR